MQDTTPPSPAVLAALDECAAVLGELRQAHARALGAVMALRRVGAVEQTGHRSLPRLLEEHVRVDPSEAKRLVRQAELLAEPEPTTLGPREPELPATAEALGAGAIGPEHVGVVDATVVRLRRVVPSLPEPVLDETERRLADLARERSPRQLKEAAHAILLRLDPDGEVPRDADRPAEELRMHTARDGTLTGRFRFAEPEAADAVRSAIESRTPAPEPEDRKSVV